jgi:hypothetical protein
VSGWWRRIVGVVLVLVLGGSPTAASICAALCVPSTADHHAMQTVEGGATHHVHAPSLPSTARAVAQHDGPVADASHSSPRPTAPGLRRPGPWGEGERLHDCCAPGEASPAASTPLLLPESHAPSFVHLVVWLPGPSTLTRSKIPLYDVLPTAPLRSRAPLVLRV